METFDVAVIGSGQGGVPLARALAERGRRVVVFEKGDFGGTCVNTGCTPSKALLASAHAAGRARRAARIGVHADLRIDGPAIFERVRGIIADWRAGVEDHLTKTPNLTLVRGEASFTGASVVRAGATEYAAATIVVDTGGTPVVPPIPGLDTTPYRTSSTFWSLTDVPERLLVLGAGYIGLELGQGCARLGSAVTLIAPNDRVLPREAADVCEVLTRAIRADGMTLRLGHQATSVTHDERGFHVTLDDGDVLEGDELLVAVGRRPVVPPGASAAGLHVDAGGGLATDAHLRTNLPHVYALGDVAGQPQFTHVAWEDHRRILDALDGGTRTRDDRVLAYATYTEPQVGRVGHDGPSAHAAGYTVREHTLPLAQVARAIEWDVTDGFLRLVVDAASDRLLGATFVGYECAELIQLVETAMHFGGTWRDLERTVYIHPTFAEGVASAARAFA